MFPTATWLADARAKLAAAGIEQPGREARLLLAHALGVTQAALLLIRGLAGATIGHDLLERRCRREPLALIVGRQEFWSLELAVSPVTLIPRPDSETLVEAALALHPQRSGVAHVLDLGTGTGCLLLAVLHEFTGAWGVGVDRVGEAAALARRNAAACGLADRCSFIAGDWAAALACRFDLIVCNPPYIARGAIASLMPEVSRYEPASALDGGDDGLDAYRALLPELPRLLAPQGAAILELAVGQAPAVAAYAREAGLVAVTVRPDLGGIKRALVLRRAP